MLSLLTFVFILFNQILCVWCQQSIVLLKCITYLEQMSWSFIVFQLNITHLCSIAFNLIQLFNSEPFSALILIKIALAFLTTLAFILDFCSVALVVEGLTPGSHCPDNFIEINRTQFCVTKQKDKSVRKLSFSCCSGFVVAQWKKCGFWYLRGFYIEI